MASGSPALDAAVELLVAAVRGGVRDIIVCPGSRSQALALVAAELERIGVARLHVRIDERSAAFLGLGIVRETGRPVPVITTSGTAVANLHPAMLEAHHCGLPLVALTADRPAEAVVAGANQTTEQVGIFGPLIQTTSLAVPDDDPVHLRWAELAGQQLAEMNHAWHLNVAYREPLSAQVPNLESRFGAGGRNNSPLRGDDINNRAGTGASNQPMLGSPAEPAPAWPGAEGDRRIHSPHKDVRGLPPELAALIAQELSQREPGSKTEIPPCEHMGDPGLDIIELDPMDCPGTIVVAGSGAGPEAERVARQGGWPLIAEVASGARFGRNLVVAYRKLLGADSPIPGLRDNIEQVIVYGRPTLSRETAALVQRTDLRVIVVDTPEVAPFCPTPEAEHTDAIRVRAFGASQHGASDELFQLRREAERNLAAWIDASRTVEREQSSEPAAPDIAASRSDNLRERAAFGKQELAVSREPITRAMLVDAVWQHTWPHDRLVLAASRLIRDFDARVPGKRVTVHANRGLAGIDGTIATGLGVAIGSQFGDDEKAQTGTTRVVTGDIAFLHDVSSLVVGQGGERTPRMQIIVGNDGGGTIFDLLEVRNSAEQHAFDRVQYTPQQLDVAAIAAAFGWEYVRATTRSELEHALTTAHERVIIEVPLPR